MDEIVDINNQIQSYISSHGDSVPITLLKLLSDLDWTIRNTQDS